MREVKEIPYGIRVDFAITIQCHPDMLPQDRWPLLDAHSFRAYADGSYEGMLSKDPMKWKPTSRERILEVLSRSAVSDYKIFIPSR